MKAVKNGAGVFVYLPLDVRQSLGIFVGDEFEYSVDEENKVLLIRKIEVEI
jgi:bifunctional DNA-binding transcriptional regulator/antitoxin component of YhaV-PrlF toxin-antitoxin module